MYFQYYFMRFVLLCVFSIALVACKTSPSVDEPAPLNTVPVANVEISSSIEGLDPALGTLYLDRFHLFPRETNGWDEGGWSAVAPSDDSRLIYVSSSSGDDSVAEFLDSSSSINLNDPGLIKPFKTIERAMEYARDGYPDWILLKRGDEWTLANDLSIPSGRAMYERFVITSYGPELERPILHLRSKRGLRIWSGVNHVAIVGLSLYADQRDPHSDDFLGWGHIQDQTGILMYQSTNEIKKSILIENNDINFFSTGINSTGSGSIDDVVIRRNIIRNSYSELSHSQGLYAVRASILLEENVFDHNGWFNRQADGGNSKIRGQATIFNHNTYLSDAIHTRFVRNIFLRSSSMQNKWTANSEKDGSVDSIKSHNLWMEENLYVGGEIGISAGGNTDYDTGPRWENITIINNTLLAIGRDQPTNRNLGWYIDASDWNGGTVCGNYLLNNDNIRVTNLLGVNLTGHSTDVKISENTIHGLIKDEPGSKSAAIKIDWERKENITVVRNNVQLAGSSMRVMIVEDSANITFDSNKYYSDANSNLWFSLSGTDHEFDLWVEKTNDINSTIIDEAFTEPKRSFETYISSIGASLSIDSFVELVVSQSKGGWRKDLTAEAISGYIREGYGDLNCTQ